MAGGGYAGASVDRDGRACRGGIGWRGAEPAGADVAIDFDGRWAAVRDANIRPYVDWRPGVPVALPVTIARPLPVGGGGGGSSGQQPHRYAGPHGRRPDSSGNGRGPEGGGGGGGRGRRRRRGRDREPQRDRPGRDQQRHSRDRDRGPRLPGFYNPAATECRF